MPRKTLIVAPPRSGTTYCSQWLQHRGYDVGHEQMGEEGMSSWLAAIETEESPFGLQPVSCHRGYDIIHVMRDPVKVVSSLEEMLIRMQRDVVGFVRKHCPIPSTNPRGQAVEFFNEWTALCETAANRSVRIEDLDGHFDRWFPRKKPSLAKKPATDLNTRGKVAPLTRSKLVPYCSPSSLAEFNRIRVMYDYI